MGYVPPDIAHSFYSDLFNQDLFAVNDVEPGG